MPHCPAQMLPELEDVEHLYLKGELGVLREVVVYVLWTTTAPQPAREVARVPQQDKTGQ